VVDLADFGVFGDCFELDGRGLLVLLLAGVLRLAEVTPSHYNNYYLEKWTSEVHPLLDAHVVEAVADAHQVAVGALVLPHQVLHLLHAPALALLVGVDLLPQPALPLALLEDELFLLGDDVLHPLELLVDLLSAEVGIPEAVLHDGDVLLEGEEVVSEECQFLFQLPL
jgi:hypothetical protein